MDPYAVLGVRPGSGNKEIAAAYREAAKRWHPDLAPGDEAAARMAEINAAYDLVRAAAQHDGQGPWRPGETTPADRAATRVRGKGAWLIPPLRLALGPELLDSLTVGEDVKLVTPTSTWASPRAILAVTDRRLLWLLDDAPTHRVRSLPYTAIAEIDHRLRRPRRKVAVLRVRTRNARTHTFSELRPETAAAIVGHVAAARLAALEAAS
jgi:DnaJ-like protein